MRGKETEKNDDQERNERDMIFDKKRNLCLEEGLAELRAHMETCVKVMFGTEE